MKNFSAKNNKSKAIINDVDITEDVLTSRTGLTLFVRYLIGIALLPYMDKLFLWRLGIVKPALILLGLDTMVMDNDEADKRHRVKPT